MPNAIKTKSIITCVKCGHKKETVMPQYSIQTAYKCDNCQVIMAVEQDSCCVYCSYGNIPCPAHQRKLVYVGSDWKIKAQGK